jgi:hypothetical protein
MVLALVVFLGVIPAALLFLASRGPSAASLRRLLATVGLQGISAANEPDLDAIGSRLRRRRVFAVAGATLGLWATATWTNGISTWNGLIPVLSERSDLLANANPGAALSTSALTLYTVTFVFTASTYGILVGYMVGIVVAEWTGRHGREGHRAALLAPHDARHYLVGWASGAVTAACAAPLVGLAVVYALDDADKRGVYANGVSYSPHWWWALTLIAVGFVALLTRWVVLSSSAGAAVADDLAAREITRALTAASMTVVAIAAFVASAASTLTLISKYFLGTGGVGEIGTATAALVLLFLALGLEFSAFLTPYWLIAVETDAPAPVAA